MDRRQPLWDFTLVRGLTGNRTGVVTRMHHCLADGLAGVSLMNILMDQSPESQPHPVRKPRFPAVSRKEPPSLLNEMITSSVSVAERVLSAQMELCHVVQQVLAASAHEDVAPKTLPQTGVNSGSHIPSVNEFTRFMPELTAATQPLPFNIICRGPQKFRWADIPLADIKAVKNACEVTVNDVALTLITSAIQRFVELHDVRIRGRLLRIVMPVSVRGNGNVRDLGNRITFVPVTIPLDIRNPRKLVAAIHKRTTFLKSAHVAECVGLAGTMLGTIPTAAQELIGPIVSQVPLGLCNIIFTNVPGPTSPLYLLGHKMLRCYPYVPIGGDLGINCAVLTYDGIAYFGFTGNALAAPDLGRLEKFLIRSFAELRKAVGIRQQRRAGTPAKSKDNPAVIPAPTPEPVLTLPTMRIPAKSVRAPITMKQTENEPLASVGV
jgi:diacylglycerol O-acyltransferase